MLPSDKFTKQTQFPITHIDSASYYPSRRCRGGGSRRSSPRGAGAVCGPQRLFAPSPAREPVEPPWQAKTAPQPVPVPRSLRRTNPTRRFAPRLARRTRAPRLPAELCGRCDRSGAVPLCERRYDLGGGRFTRRLGASTRPSEGVVLRLEKRLQAPADVARSDRRERTGNPFRGPVRQTRHAHHGAIVAASQGPRGAPSRYASRPPEQEDAACGHRADAEPQ